MGGTRVELATSTMSTSESSIVSNDTKQLTKGVATVCTRVCTSDANLQQTAAELRRQFSADECRRLASLLTANQTEGGA